ncbi:uncharacterized protein LOC110608432 isoform X2 [Manihot esculenta]|uniref:uncharacterized protein LOC110608432 isoform X2 n=1 Tax=Manihot esculenta TaxID=3983 RepID=UPI001CC82DDF|nr:uncharacterized protein LOC110608432 isoform X2 [Manihot esculenta]
MTRANKKKSNPNTQTPTQPSTLRPQTRSLARGPNILVSEPTVMGDSVQDQLTKLLNIVLSEQQANQLRHDKVEQLHAKMDAMSLDLNSVKQACSTSPEAESQARPRRDKGTVGTSSSVTTRDCSFVPKYTKLDFPRYNGTEDPLGWISRCQHFFKHQSTPDDEQVGLASYHLEGIAQLWYLQLIQDVPNPTWVEFVDQCNLRFGPPIRSNKLGELAKLKQTGTVEDYQTKFEILVSRAGTLGSNQKVQLYISGLQEYIAVEVELHQPKDLATAMSMSRLYERKLYSKSVTQREVRRPAPLSEHRPCRTIKRLTPDEMDERQKKGLCFNCDEPFVRGRQCKHLFLIDLDDDSKSDAESDSDSPPEISLHAITGTRNSQSMQLLGCWHGRQVLILVDSGSTHSFVSNSVVADLQVTVDAKDGLRVKVANGEQLHSPGLCKGAPIELGNSVFTVDLFVLQLTGFDLVFGVNWLATLGPILWDFNSMWMSFFVNGKQVALTGIDSKSETNSSLTAMLRKNSFHWTDDAVKAFEELKRALTTTPILALPNFELMFILECDASESGIGAVLLQETKPVAFFSRALATRHTKLPAYERELIGLVKAIKHWQSYLWGKKFLVRTDHYTLKFLLEQRSLSSSQQYWVSKLLPFDFTVEYKAGKSNIVANALSRRDSDQPCFLALSMPQLDLFDDIRQEQQPLVPFAILGQRCRSGKQEVLVHWSQSSPADSSWENVQDLLARFPDFTLADKLPNGAGSTVTRPLQVYTRNQQKHQPRVMLMEVED